MPEHEPDRVRARARAKLLGIIIFHSENVISSSIVRCPNTIKLPWWNKIIGSKSVCVLKPTTTK